MKTLDLPYPLPEGMVWAVSEGAPEEIGAHGKNKHGLEWWHGWLRTPYYGGAWKAVTHKPDQRPQYHEPFDSKEEALRFLSAYLILGDT